MKKVARNHPKQVAGPLTSHKESFVCRRIGIELELKCPASWRPLAKVSDQGSHCFRKDKIVPESV